MRVGLALVGTCRFIGWLVPEARLHKPGDLLTLGPPAMLRRPLATARPLSCGSRAPCTSSDYAYVPKRVFVQIFCFSSARGVVAEPCHGGFAL
jgi:hypothetical protein